MNLQDQLGTLESSLNALLQAAASNETSREPAADTAASSAASSVTAPADAPAKDEKPTLHVSRPDRDVIEMTIAGKSVLLNPEGVSELIEELANVRASMTPEQPAGVAPGWRFAATKNPVMATQKYANGDRLLLMRHGGHGWVPFTFSPNMVIELYAMLTKK
jgi:hypothetical protein